MKPLIQRARLIVLTALAFAGATSVSVSSPTPLQSQCSGCLGVSYGLDSDSSQAGTISIVAHPNDGQCNTQTCQKFPCEYDTITTWSLGSSPQQTYTECNKTGRKWECNVSTLCCVSGLGQFTDVGALPCGGQIQTLFSTAGLSVVAAGDCTACVDTQ